MKVKIKNGKVEDLACFVDGQDCVMEIIGYWEDDIVFEDDSLILAEEQYNFWVEFFEDYKDILDLVAEIAAELELPEWTIKEEIVSNWNYDCDISTYCGVARRVLEDIRAGVCVAEKY
jgi:hypothetical protein